ncbi:hypothetical protein AOLI_G00325380 [Acnodon oligacanthus]
MARAAALTKRLAAFVLMKMGVTRKAGGKGQWPATHLMRAWRSGEREGKPMCEPRVVIIEERRFQSCRDALLRLASIVDASNLRVAIKETLEALLPKVESVFVYLLEAESQMVCDDPPHELHAEGKLSLEPTPQATQTALGDHSSRIAGLELAKNKQESWLVKSDQAWQ